MVAASLMRALAAVMLYVHPTAYLHSYRCSAVLFAVSLLAADDEALAQKLDAFRRRQTETVLQMELPAAGE